MLLVLLAAMAMGGCTRVRTALAVQGDDTVAGEIVVARAGGPPPAIVLPLTLVGRVSVSPYVAEEYQGSRLQFGELRFDELNSLATAAPQAEGRFRLILRRVGNRIVLGGQVDLASIPVDRADVRLKVAFPGEVLDTDGTIEDTADDTTDDTAGTAGTTVGWVFTPGQVSEFTAVIGSPDPAAPSVARWTLLVTAIVAAAAVVAVLLARAHRNPPVGGAGRGP